MGSDKLTKKLGQFIAFGTLASASIAYASDTVKVDPVPGVAPVTAVKEKKAKKVKPVKSIKHSSVSTAKVSPSK